MTLLSRESAMAPGGQRLAASVSGVSLAVLGGKVRGMEEEDQVTLVARDEEGAGRRGGARQAARCVLGGLLFLGGSLAVAMFLLYIFHQLSL